MELGWQLESDVDVSILLLGLGQQASQHNFPIANLSHLELLLSVKPSKHFVLQQDISVQIN
jgi:hypothetical protein